MSNSIRTDKKNIIYVVNITPVYPVYDFKIFYDYENAHKFADEINGEGKYNAEVKVMEVNV